MKNKFKLMASVCVFIIAGASGNSYAQEAKKTDDTVIKTRSIKVDGDTDKAPYEASKGVESGISKFTQKAIEEQSRSSGDANELLRILPNIHYDKAKNSATATSLQDIHPADISISGGRYYENLVTLDGIGVGTRLDTTNSMPTEDNPANLTEVAGVRAQSQWVDTSLIGSVELMDSNISAEYGAFTGGVLDVKTRNPYGVYGVNANTSCTNNDLTHLITSEAGRIEYAASLADTKKPEYQRCNLGISVDLPQIYGTNILIAHNKQFSDVTYSKNAAYGGGEYKSTSESTTTMIKAVRDFGELFRLEGQYTNSPYSSEYQLSNTTQNQIVTYGGGDRAKIEIKSRSTPILGAKDWSFELNYSDDDSSRTAAPVTYAWPSSVAEFKVCTSANCTFGGFGDIDQNEKELTTNVKATWDVPFGSLRIGSGYEKETAEKHRGDNVYAYSVAATGSNIVCGSADDTACRNGLVALTRRFHYVPYDIKVSLETANLWAEYNANFGKLNTRFGVRGDYDSFLENTDIAPRFSASYDFGKFDIFAGANRYYSKSFLGYAIREKMPATYRYVRTATTSGASKIYYNDNWTLDFYSQSATYRNANLKTPYSDELTAGFNAELPFGVRTRVKYIHRDTKDEIVSSASYSDSYINPVTNKPATYLNYKATNDGYTKFEGASIELFKNIGKNHSLAFNVNWSDEKSLGSNYFDDEVTSYIYYAGNIISKNYLSEITKQANFSEPLLANLNLTSKWFNSKLTSNLGVRWHGEYEAITLKQISGIKVNGIWYDVYGNSTYKAAAQFDLKLNYEFISAGRNKIYLTADITNLFDKSQNPIADNIDGPYEKGRTIWLGANYKF